MLEDWNSIFRNIASLDTFAQNMIQSLYHHIKTDKVDELSITVIMILNEYEIMLKAYISFGVGRIEIFKLVAIPYRYSSCP